MMQKHKKRHALLAGLMVSSLAFSSLGVSAVFAADDATTKEATAAASSIVASTKVSLTIHKYTPSTKPDAEAKLQATGKELNVGTDLPGAKTVEGVAFTGFKVQYDGKDIDLTTNAGWALVTKFKELFDKDNTNSSWTDTAGKKFTLVQGPVGTTNAMGTVTFTEGSGSSLSKTVYVFRETVPKNSTQIKVGGTPLTDKETLTPAAPFIVTLPMTDPTNQNTWMYNIHVYPKNSVTTIKKDVGDSVAPGAQLTKGSVVPYTITVDIPKAENGFKKFYLIDILPKELTYIGDQADTKDFVEIGTLVDGKFQASSKLGNNDFTLISAPYTGTVPAHQGKNIITMNVTNPSGTFVLDNNQGKKIRWTLHTRVNTGNAEVNNSATVLPLPVGETDSGWDPNTPDSIPPGPVTPEVKTYYGSAVIQKRATDDETRALQGATFELYQCNEKGEFVKPDFTVTQNKEEAKVSTNNKSSWETGQDGNVTISGLLVNDWRNNSDTMADGSTKWADKSFYCLVETKAPVGYELLPKPVMFQISKNSTDRTVNVKVLDVPKNGNFALPLTGANGITLMVVVGILLVGGSGLYVASVSRKNKKESKVA